MICEHSADKSDGKPGRAMYQKTVLVVDDEETVRRVVRKVLGSDYAVLEAMDGEAAVDIAKRQKPDLILMDLMMPKMDGYTACSSIKADQATKVIPVVMLTGVGHELNKKLAKGGRLKIRE